MKYFGGDRHAQRPGEELANGITHAVGTLASITALVLLVVFASLRGDAMRIVTLSIFGVSLVLLYLASTLYHLAGRPSVKRFFMKCDHTAIYVLIAGTYTPFMLVTLRGGWGWSLFGVVWGLAALGVCLRLLFVNRFRFVAALLYVAMGWLVVIGAPPVIAAMSGTGLTLLLIGGVTYSAGVAFYLWDHLPFNHAIWHLFVMAGSTCHVLAACQDVLVMP
ncbi:MAG: hemolysin III family protein [Phycisphaerales bacterium]|nr:hemolysin III family protein [Phycisphaerales bacterium]